MEVGKYLLGRLSSKKFAAFLIIVVLGTLLLVFGQIEKGIWQSIVQFITPLYFGADAAQEGVRHYSENMHPKGNDENN